MFYDIIVDRIKKFSVKVREVSIAANGEDINNVVGHKRENIEKLKEIYDVEAKVVKDNSIKKGNVKVDIIKACEIKHSTNM